MHSHYRIVLYNNEDLSYSYIVYSHIPDSHPVIVGYTQVLLTKFGDIVHSASEVHDCTHIPVLLLQMVFGTALVQSELAVHLEQIPLLHIGVCASQSLIVL